MFRKLTNCPNKSSNDIKKRRLKAPFLTGFYCSTENFFVLYKALNISALTGNPVQSNAGINTVVICSESKDNCMPPIILMQYIMRKHCAIIIKRYMSEFLRLKLIRLRLLGMVKFFTKATVGNTTAVTVANI